MSNEKSSRSSLIGKIFGSWTIIEQAEDYVSGKQMQAQKQWLCKCTCGVEKKFTTYAIKKQSKECSHIWGKRFSKLVVIGPAERPEGNKTGTFVKCKCDCGNEYICNKRSLLVGDAKSCGCSRINFEDFTGQRFGSLLVIKRADYKKDKVYWDCKCDCGNEIIVSSVLLKNGKQSCGCIKYKPSNFIDLVGKRFGHLAVIEQADNIISGGQTKVAWKCRCDCGNEITARGDSLKNGHKTSCGCYANNTVDASQDLTGHRFDMLEVIGRYDNRQSLWMCRCDCGKEVVRTRKQLLQNKTNSCGCQGEIKKFDVDIGSTFGDLTIIDQLETTHEKMRWLCRCSCGREVIVNTSDLTCGHRTDCGHVLDRKKNLVGLRFGRLTVLEGIPGYYQSRWRCLCDCGNVTEAFGNHLKSGNVQSCGCLAKERTTERCLEDLKGKRFGLWTVIEKAEKPQNVKHGTFWKCRCDCGNFGIIAASELKHNKSRSCGCNNRSKFEMWTEDALKALNIDYKSQIKFDGLTGIGDGQLSYDFGAYNKEKLIALIECQGSQHFEPVAHFGGEKQFERQQKHDKLKKDYAEELNVQFIEIPYWAKEYEDIYSILNTLLG